MFFMGIEGLATSNFSALHEAANEKIAEAGFKPESVRSAIAVHENCNTKGEKGVVVLLPDGDKMNFYRALALKDALRHGTYTVLLNESSLPNCSFQALVKHGPGRSLNILAEQWRDAAEFIHEMTGIFVAGLVYEKPEGFCLIGNANPTMAGDMFNWQKAVESLCHNLGTEYPEFYQAELRPAPVLPRHRRIGVVEEEEQEEYPSIH